MGDEFVAALKETFKVLPVPLPEPVFLQYEGETFQMWIDIYRWSYLWAIFLKSSSFVSSRRTMELMTS